MSSTDVPAGGWPDDEGLAVTGLVFDVERFSMHDGPGIRTVVFLKGCPLRCTWCHNPESYLGDRQLHYNPEMCIGCGECARVCPEGAHVMMDGRHTFVRDRCRGCMRCAEVCASEALEVVGRSMKVQEVLGLVLRDRRYFDNSGGGLTVSGGEPFAQAPFLLRLLGAARDHDLHTCVETSGFGSDGAFRASLDLVNLYLFDYKETDSDRHREFTGQPLEPILGTLRLLDEGGATIVLRCPLVPGYNYRRDHLQGIAELSRKLRKCVGVEVLGYHGLGDAKSRRVGSTIPRPDPGRAQSMSREEAEAAARTLADLGAVHPVVG